MPILYDHPARGEYFNTTRNWLRYNDAVGRRGQVIMRSCRRGLKSRYLFSPVHTLTTGPRVGEAMWRTVRWLDRCIEYHEKSGKKDQNLFAIVQGGIDGTLRDQCLDEMIKRKDRVAGYAIGGLSGGEEKGES